mmetsp:Transcript_5268/g.16970  ORF Transcript_5268/g.16970 Transcript_5268/m.16970 type:complete len:358 (-) Transcript_5268:376-1449(-)
MRHLEARDPGRPKVTAQDIAAKPDCIYPLVRTHPDTGRRALFLNPKNTKRVVRLGASWPEACDDPAPPDGLPTDADGVAFVKSLAQRVIDTGVYAHQWQRGDLVLWDNRQLMHAATPFDADKYERLLFRAEFSGEPVLHRPIDAPAASLTTRPPSHPLQSQCDFYLAARPESVAWGYIDPKRGAQLVVSDGATVAIDTVTSGGPACLPCDEDGGGSAGGGGGSSWQTPSALHEIHLRVQQDRIGVHVLTGPVFVRGAAPGDVLRVDVLEVALLADWAWTMSRPYGGALEWRQPPHLRHTRLDAKAGVARPPWGGELDLRPFFGVMATAPPVGFGRQLSIARRCSSRLKGERYRVRHV